MLVILILSILLLLYGVVGVILSFMTFQGGRDTKKILFPYKVPSIIVGVVLFIFSTIITKIDPQDAGVLITPGGVDDNELHTGWHVVMPWNHVVMMDKTVWVYTCANATKDAKDKPDAEAIWAPTKDGIKMGFDVSVSWKIEADNASWIYANISENDGGISGRYYWLEENVIRPKLKSAMALTVSNYSPIEAYSVKRQEIQDNILQRMRKEVKGYHLIVDQVDMREVFYNPQYESAINSKKLAEQEVLRLVEVTRQREEELKQSSIEKDISIQRAEGEAKALQIKGNSITNNPNIIQLEWINKWDGSLPQYMMGNGQGVMINLKDK